MEQGPDRTGGFRPIVRFLSPLPETHAHIHARTDRQTDKQADRQIYGQMDGRMDGRAWIDR